MKNSSILITNLLFVFSLQAQAEVQFEQAYFSLGSHLNTQAVFFDKDNDGDLDVVTYSQLGNGTNIYVNRNSSFALDAYSPLIGKESALAIDMNGDGFDDLVSYPFRISLNDGAGKFLSPSTQYSVDFSGGGSYEIEKLDLDNNGVTDFIVSFGVGHHSRGGSFLFRNAQYDVAVDGNISFMSEEDLSLVALNGASVSHKSRGVVAADLNGDGIQDLILVNAPTQNTSVGSAVMINDGTGNLLPSQFISGAEDISLGDFDNDGDLDAFLARPDKLADEVWLNDGFGSFSNSGQILGSSDSIDSEVADFDGDGDLDVISVVNNEISSDQLQTHSIWLNDGAGVFEKSSFEFGAGHITKSLNVVDIDADGDMDIITMGGAQYYESYASIHTSEIWLNQLVPNDVSDASYQDGIAYCQLSPADCGLYVLSDVELAYEGGFDQGKESCALNPASCDLFSIDDLEAAKNEGEKTGFNNGQAACISDPETCDLFDQDDLEEAYEIGVTDGNQQCIDDPAYCGLFDQTDVDNIVETEKTALLHLIVQDLPRGIIVSRCKKNPQSPLCEFVDIKRDKKKAKRTKKQKKQTS